ncbi:DUF4012 domain-containing protein [Rhodococcus rhodnii]|uniref:DUF4012 domain-containing protein n=1 Tax=Rhodococcus rhodnii LMG 5362 TaxID=1273125 RepID=R7WKY6_9NOCA|nr:DUF4012 domain-containing protein [Rhodococcus rhodnii]EOM75963.1 hypothetical protein Rrhod_2717 [Rhodococcus rhodnii LMG 5362]
MNESEERAGAAPGGASRDPAHTSRNRRALGLGLAGIVVVGLVCAGWIGWSALEARDALYAARDDATRAKDALLSGDADTARAASVTASTEAARAVDLTSGVVWSAASAVPWLGSPFASTQQMTAIVHGLTADVLTPAVDAGTALSPARMLGQAGAVDLQALRDAEPALATAAAAAADLDARAQAVPEPAYLGAITDARTQLAEQTAELDSLLTVTATAARIAPGLLGADGPRTYFLAFQTNAEARGTGGLVGGFGIVRADGGRITVDDLGTNVELPASDPRTGRPPEVTEPVDLGPEFAQQWGGTGAAQDFRNSNLSAHFPYAAQIWRSMWAHESGDVVDGAIATDPVALSYILGATGPVTLPDGRVVTGENVVELTQSTLYQEFADDNTGRKRYLETIAATVVARMSGAMSSPAALLEALGRAAGEGRLSVWSADPDAQSVLEETPLGGAIPTDDAPYAAVVVNNHAGNKLDYYLRREISYTAQSCDGPTRESKVTVSLTNDTPFTELTGYVAGQAQNQLGAEKYTNVAWVSLVATNGATLTSVTVDDTPAFAFTGAERGHPMYDIIVPIPRGETVTLQYTLDEPTAAGAARVPVQPLVDDPVVTVDVPVCG